MDAGCRSFHYQNLKRREAIQRIAGNPYYDADLVHLRDDYRSVAFLAAFCVDLYVLFGSEDVYS